MNLEHVNLTVTDPKRSAGLFERIFGWHTRWSGDAIFDGECIHVGSDETYLALYSRPDVVDDRYQHGYDRPGLAHVGLLIDERGEFDAIEQRVDDEGIETFNHNEIPPGRRFYFFDPDGICFEVATYA